MSLRVFELAATASMQDGGRWGRRRFGVPPGGAFDMESLQLANALLGNDLAAPAVELALSGGKFQAEEPMQLALAGAAFGISINGVPNNVNASISLERGDVLDVSAPIRGVRAYLAAPGGWEVAAILDSVSGAQVPRSLKPRSGSNLPNLRLLAPPDSLATAPFRCLPGPHASMFDLSSIFQAPYAVSLNSNRVGLRLQGHKIEGATEIVSEPSCVGAVQVTPEGGLLVVGPDGPTIGGYPKIAVVCKPDLNRLGQLSPGQKMTFEPISVDRARALEEERLAELAARLAKLRVALSR